MTSSSHDSILKLLRKHSGQDFFGYKDGPILRGVEHRMRKNRIASVEEYVTFLKREPEEIDKLHRELLVGVTRFFRDKVAFADLDKLALSSLIDGSPCQTLRFWVVGCSTGEEVYSLAMLAQERIEACRHQPALKIFATDIQPEALGVARAGIYPLQVSENISEARLKRFFEPHPDGFKVKPTIRRPIIFSTHSILHDIPFSRLDLVNFRNLLIYLEPDAQREALTKIHYALKPNGFLFVGHSESVEGHDDLFRQIDRGGNIYQTVVKSHQGGTASECFPMSPRQLTLQPGGKRIQVSSALVGAREAARARTEELQSVNEELQSANEELQSTNEELATLRDELQATNEELRGRCLVLEKDLEKADRDNNEMENAFRSFGVGVIVLDLELRILRHTWAVTRVVQLIPADAGRPLADLRLWLKLEMTDLSDIVKSVLRDLEPFQQNVQHEDGHWYAMKVSPSRRANNSIEGVSLTFLE
ncbi:MAG TPA: hypothetical protein EYO33_12995, partial [Phycisphaerales bacterium]|nr:hypothetical protein [Phycisphaerales bacterium]